MCKHTTSMASDVFESRLDKCTENLKYTIRHQSTHEDCSVIHFLSSLSLKLKTSKLEVNNCQLFDSVRTRHRLLWLGKPFMNDLSTVSNWELHELYCSLRPCEISPVGSFELISLATAAHFHPVFP